MQWILFERESLERSSTRSLDLAQFNLRPSPAVPLLLTLVICGFMYICTCEKDPSLPAICLTPEALSWGRWTNHNEQALWKHRISVSHSWEFSGGELPHLSDKWSVCHLLHMGQCNSSVLKQGYFQQHSTDTGNCRHFSYWKQTLFWEAVSVHQDLGSVFLQCCIIGEALKRHSPHWNVGEYKRREAKQCAYKHTSSLCRFLALSNLFLCQSRLVMNWITKSWFLLKYQ